MCELDRQRVTLSCLLDYVFAVEFAYSQLEVFLFIVTVGDIKDVPVDVVCSLGCGQCFVLRMSDTCCVDDTSTVCDHRSEWYEIMLKHDCRQLEQQCGQGPNVIMYGSRTQKKVRDSG